MHTQRIQDLIALVSSAGIDELTVCEDGLEVTLRKGDAVVPSAPVAPAATSATAAPNAAPSPPARRTVKAPMVGTFYLSATPEGATFVQPGQAVATGDIVCIIEAMKVMNEIEATAAGVVVEILCRSGDLVEAGQDLLVLA